MKVVGVDDDDVAWLSRWSVKVRMFESWSSMG